MEKLQFTDKILLKSNFRLKFASRTRT